MASYNSFKTKIQRNEGGYQKLKNDSGNYNSQRELVGTNYGVSAKFYETVLKRPPTEFDMRNLTQEKAHQLFKKYFWDKMQGDNIKSQMVADMLIDHGINSYPSTATKIIQRLLNKCFDFALVPDGKLGVKTLTAINSVDEKKLFIGLANERIKAYNSYRDCSSFCPIWHERVFYIARYYGINIEPLPCQKKKD